MVFDFLLKHLHRHAFLQYLIHIMNQQVLMVTIEIQHQHFSKQSLECIDKNNAILKVLIEFKESQKHGHHSFLETFIAPICEKFRRPIQSFLRTQNCNS